MRKIFAILFMSGFTCAICMGQEFIILPGSEIEAKGTSSQEQIIGAAKFVSTSKEKKSYEWYRVKKNVPSGWAITTCVPGKCYAQKESGSFTVEPGKSGILDQNFFPQGIEGNAEVDVFIYEKGKKDKQIKVNYKAEAVGKNN